MNYKITKREVLTSITIFAVMLLIGILISSKISERIMDTNEVYNKAVKINDADMFAYGMRTNIGNAFIYGDLEAVDTVTFPEIGGNYMYAKKVREVYTMHTRLVTYTTGSGKTRSTHTRTETYWTWDYAGEDVLRCNEISFLGSTFAFGKIKTPSDEYITTIKESGHVRYQYYGVATKYTGTIFAELKDKTIADNTPFYKDLTIDDTVKQLESNHSVVFFWIGWVVLILACVYLFYRLDNKWLENSDRKGTL